ncbi:NHL repeat-containing protein [Pseudomonas sp. PB3P13]
MNTSLTAGPGDRDPTFANDGALVLKLANFEITHGQFVAEGPDGNSYIAGTSWEKNTQASEHVSVTRLLPDGTLDFGFGEYGTRHVKIIKENLSRRPMQMFFVTDQGENWMIVCLGYYPRGLGTVTEAHVLMGLTDNGELKTDFGDGGLVFLTSPFEPGPQQSVAADANQFATSPNSSVCLSDGKIYLMTSGIDPKLGVVVGVVSCYDLKGTLIPTFGDKGHATLSSVLAVRHSFNGIDVHDTGITVCGWVGRDALVARFHMDGSIDRSLNEVGYITEVGPSIQYDGLKVLPDGRTVAVGFGFSPRLGLLSLYTKTGLKDPTFNKGERIEESFDSPRQVIFSSVAIDDDKIIAAGRIFAGIEPSFVTAKYQMDGQRDPGFGKGQGYSITEVTGHTPVANGMTLQADKKILLVGDNLPGIFSDAAIVIRLLNGG